MRINKLEAELPEAHNEHLKLCRYRKYRYILKIKKNIITTYLFPDGDDKIQDDALPRGSTGPKPKWAELLTTCQPRNRAKDCTALI